MLDNILDAKGFQSTTLFRATILCVVFVLFSAYAGRSQPTYDSGSTGADGALDLSIDQPGCPAAQTTCVLQLPPSGVLNFTTVNIPAGKTLRFTRNALNTPVFILAQGEVRVFGTIDISGGSVQSTNQPSEFSFPLIGGLGGPGGFDGGAAGTRFQPYTSGLAGNGPGGGGAGDNSSNPTGSSAWGGGGGFVVAGPVGPVLGMGISGLGGLPYGNKSLVPLIGGSGGGGGTTRTGSRGSGGGGGGGAILIASSTIIRFNDGGGSSSGIINAIGGSSADQSGGCGSGGGGAGGAIRLVSREITGRLDLRVNGGTANHNSGGCGSATTTSSHGRIRLEAYSYPNATFQFNSVPGTGLSIEQLPLPAFPSSVPSLTITSVGGQNVQPPETNSPHGHADLYFGNAVSNPLTVGISASNIPVGTGVAVTLQPNLGARTTVNSSPLSGTLAASTATASITVPEGTSLISATVTFFAQSGLTGKPLAVGGEKIERIEVTSTVGGKSEITYITASNKRIKESETRTLNR